MKIKLKNSKKVTLEDLLRRRKLSFSEFVLEHSITSHEELQSLCKKLDVQFPSEDFLNKNLFKSETKPEDGVVVVEVESLQEESTSNSNVSDSLEEKKKKKKRKEE